MVGVRAPEPIAFASRGGLFYDSWLITREIPKKSSFAEIDPNDQERLKGLISDTVNQIGILIRNNIFHIDLHPGNVLIGKDDTVYLLDFDKAYIYQGKRNDLRDLYLLRWRRAVIKHRLPESFSELLCPGLRCNFENEV
jgi:RIO-like serine/threonine protein kinase